MCADEMVETEELECIHNHASVGICLSFEVGIYIPGYCDCYRVRSQLLKQQREFFAKCCRIRLRCWAVDCELDTTTHVFKRAHVELGYTLMTTTPGFETTAIPLRLMLSMSSSSARGGGTLAASMNVMSQIAEPLDGDAI